MSNSNQQQWAKLTFNTTFLGDIYYVPKYYVQICIHNIAVFISSTISLNQPSLTQGTG